MWYRLHVSPPPTFYIGQHFTCTIDYGTTNYILDKESLLLWSTDGSFVPNESETQERVIYGVKLQNSSKGPLGEAWSGTPPKPGPSALAVSDMGHRLSKMIPAWFRNWPARRWMFQDLSNRFSLHWIIQGDITDKTLRRATWLCF